MFSHFVSLQVQTLYLSDRQSCSFEMWIWIPCGLELQLSTGNRQLHTNKFAGKSERANTQQRCQSREALSIPKFWQHIISASELRRRQCLFPLLRVLSAASLTKASNTRVSKVSLSEFSIMMLKRASRVSCRNWNDTGTKHVRRRNKTRKSQIKKRRVENRLMNDPRSMKDLNIRTLITE